MYGPLQKFKGTKRSTLINTEEMEILIPHKPRIMTVQLNNNGF